MSQTYYFKLPLYLEQGDTIREAVITFDGVEVAGAEVASTDRANPTNLIFSVDKEPGIYTLTVSIATHVEPWAVLVVDDIWMSIDNTNWKSAIINKIKSDAPDASYGFDPVKGCGLFGDEARSWNLSLVSADVWDSQYSSFSQIYPELTDSEINEKFNNDAEMVEKFKIAKAALTARGYN